MYFILIFLNYIFMNNTTENKLHNKMLQNLDIKKKNKTLTRAEFMLAQIKINSLI